MKLVDLYSSDGGVSHNTLDREALWQELKLDLSINFEENLFIPLVNAFDLEWIDCKNVCPSYWEYISFLGE